MTRNRWQHDPAEAWLAYEPSAADPRDSSKELRLHRRAGFAALAVLMLAGAGMCQRGMARADAPAAEPSPKPTATADDDAGKKPVRYHVYGRVADLDDKPVANADVYWEIRERKPDGQIDWQRRKIIARTKTNEQGLYKLDAELVRSDVAGTFLTVRAKHHGVHSMIQNRGALKPHNFRLWRSYPVEGTIYTPNGEPVAGARVMVTTIQRGSSPQGTNKPERYDRFHLQLANDEIKADQPRPYWPQPVVTDTTGKFRIDDAIPDKAVGILQVWVANFAPTRVAVGKPDSLKPTLQETYRKPKFILVLEAPFVIHGRFLDEATDEPIAGARIEVQPYMNRGSNRETIEATSNDEGRYSLRLGSADLYFVKVFPPLGYPAVQTSISARQIARLAGTDRQLDYEVKLRRGLILAGRVVDSASGHGVAKAQVYYKPEAGRKLGVNRRFFPVTTADDGSFQLTAVDGKGFLLVDAPGQGFYRLAVDGRRINHYHEGLFPHGLVEIDVPSEGSPEPFTIALDKGPELVLRVLDPEGKPVEGKLRAACAESNFEGSVNNTACKDGRFRLEAVEPGRKYRVYLFAKKTVSGTTIEVEAPADGEPIDVTLQPCATIRGRYVYDGGVPAPEVTNFTKFRLYPDRDPEGAARSNLPYYDNFSGHQHVKRVTDEDGNFVLDGIVPGAFIYLRLNNRFSNGKGSYEIGTLEPGEVKDVGDLVITP